MTADEPQDQLAIEELARPAERRPDIRRIAIQFDGMTLRTNAGEEIATLTAAGWITPDGIPTECVEIPLPAPVAVVAERDRLEHERRADKYWLDVALDILREVAHSRQTFTVDDVWAQITMPPRDARAQMSRLMRAGERVGLMRLTDDTRPCMRNDGGRRVRVWRSLIYRAARP